MASTSQRFDDFSALCAAILPSELEALRALPWQKAAIPLDAVVAQFSTETGLTTLQGAVPFLETEKIAPPEGDDWLHLKNEIFTQFLLAHKALCRAYLHEIQARHLVRVGDFSPARMTHVTTELSGMAAANLAIYIAAQCAENNPRPTLVVDADPKGQYVFPLLDFKDVPKVLTEHLQKPSTFKADLAACVAPLQKNLAYLNLQASSLRPFTDDELSNIVGFLEEDYEHIVVYAGRHRSRFLTQNATTNYAVCNAGFRGELAAITRHASGMHTVLIKSGKSPFDAALNGDFERRAALDFWKQPHDAHHALREFILTADQATNLIFGGNAERRSLLHCHAGLDLYLHYAGSEAASPEATLQKLQKKLSAYYPRDSFFSARSATKSMAVLPQRTATALVETGTEPQLVSLIGANELRAAAIFPAGITPAIVADGVRFSSCGAAGLARFRQTFARGGFTAFGQVPRWRMRHPNALGAVMEQLQI